MPTDGKPPRRQSSSRAVGLDRASTRVNRKFKVSQSKELVVGELSAARWDGAPKVVHDFGDTVTSVSFSSDRQYCAAGGTNKKAYVYHAKDGEVAAEFSAESGVNAVAIMVDAGRAWVLAGTFGGWVRAYSVQTKAETFAAKAFVGGQAVLGMRLASETQRLAVGGQGPHIVLYQAELPGWTTAVQAAPAAAPGRRRRRPRSRQRWLRPMSKRLNHAVNQDP